MVPGWASKRGHRLWPWGSELHSIVHDCAALLVGAPLQQPGMLQRLSSGKARVVIPAEGSSLLSTLGIASSIMHTTPSTLLHRSASATVMRTAVTHPTQDQYSSAQLTHAQQMCMESHTAGHITANPTLLRIDVAGL